jgi:putative sigma-54 modulation protein
MKIKIFGKNIEVTPGIKSAIEDKLGKLDKYFTKETDVDVTLSVDKNEQKVEVTIPVKGGIIRAEEISNDMYASIDMVEETIERQLVKYKNKLTDKKRAYKESFTSEFIEQEYDEDEEDAVIIERTKRFGIKPMDPEEACIQMELLGHSFFVFLNAETDEVNVVYKRKSGAYGLIEPELD